MAGFVGLGLLASAAGAALGPGGVLAWARGLQPMPGGLLAFLLLGADALPGVAAWLVWRRVDVGLHRKRAALRWWGWTLAARAAWAAAGAMTPSPDARLATVAALAAVFGLTLLTIRAFWPLQRPAAAMLLPYIACIAAAGWFGASL